MASVDISIVIVNWKVKDLLKRCLESIHQHTKGVSFEIFVIDNNSQDGSVEMLRKDFPDVRVIASSVNLGFSKGQNKGILPSQGKYVLILNPDTYFQEDSLTKMYAWMEGPEHARVGFLGPRLVYADGRLQPSIKHFPTLLSQVIILLKLHHVSSWFPPVRHYLWKDFDYTKEQPVEQIMGAAIFARGDVLRDVLKGFDEDFWLWFEDIDICQRMLQAGYENWYSPVTTIFHEEGKSFGQVMAPRKQKIFNNGLKVYAGKYFGMGGSLLITFLHPVSMLLSYVVSWLHIRPRPQSHV